MFKFDVKYTFDNYVEYYKYALIKSKIFRDIVLSLCFIGIGAYYLIDQTEKTEGYILPIFAIAMAFVIVGMNFVTFPLVKKQLKQKQAEIDATHILITFEEGKIIYENLTVKTTEPAKASEEVKNEEVKEEPTSEATTEVEETKAEAVDEANEASKDSQEVKKDPNVFELQYVNFQRAIETANLFLFYLDRQTVIILPKATIIEGEMEGFVELLKSKINPRALKLLKK